LGDGAEVNPYLTNPNNADSDGDGFTDGVEILDGTNPNNATSHSTIPRAYPAALNTDAATDGTRWDFFPQLTTDGVGHWVAVWSALYFDAFDVDVLVSRSADNGATWTAPAALNTDAATDTRRDGYPQVTTDGAGNWVAVWNSTVGFPVGGTTPGTDGNILVSRSADNGATWTPPATIAADTATDDEAAQVTTDGAGHWVAVWLSNRTLGGTIGTDFDILVSRSTDNGANWTAPTALNTNAGSDSGADYVPQVTTDRAGNWVAVWNSSDTLGATIGTDFDILVSRSTDNGATWTAPAALNTNAGSDFGADWFPQVTTDGAGNWLAVWQSTDTLGATIGTDYDILISRSADNGATWTAPAALNTNAGTDSSFDEVPQVTTDGAGDWLAVWQSTDTLGGTIGTDYDTLVSRSTDNGATWTAPTALNANAMTDSDDDGAAQVTTDGAGHWIAVWFSGIGSPDYDILFTRWTLDTDGDGMPDSWELAHGLNPNSATGLNGAGGDLDGDGLTNLQEFNLRTNPQSADSDGDTLGDGLEVNTWNTNPKRVDTDGDTFNDDFEVMRGSDPTDANSTPYPPALFRVREAVTLVPIHDARVTVRRKNTVTPDKWFESVTAHELPPDGSGDAMYKTSYMDLLGPNEVYEMTAAAPGYLVSAPVNITTSPSGLSPVDVVLVKDTGFTLPNILNVTIEQYTSLGMGGVTTGNYLLTDNIVVKKNNIVQPTGIAFKANTIELTGVPYGDVEVSLTLAEYTSTPVSVTVGTGFAVDVAMKAALPSARTILGWIGGRVMNNQKVPPEPVKGAFVLIRQSAYLAQTYVRTGSGGVFSSDQIPTGAGTIQAYSANGALVGPRVPLTVLAAGASAQIIPDLLVALAPNDRDGDGMPDTWESDNGLDPDNARDEKCTFPEICSKSGPTSDVEPDGLSNLGELALGSNANQADFDHDGFPDGAEVAAGSNPSDINSTPSMSSEIWVEFGSNYPAQIGGLFAPYPTIFPNALNAGALAWVLPGQTIYIKGDAPTKNSNQIGTITKAVTLQAMRGTVRIGTP
jgi:hypothetical protein